MYVIPCDSMWLRDKNKENPINAGQKSTAETASFNLFVPIQPTMRFMRQPETCGFR